MGRGKQPAKTSNDPAGQPSKGQASASSSRKHSTSTTIPPTSQVPAISAPTLVNILEMSKKQRRSEMTVTLNSSEHVPESIIVLGKQFNTIFLQLSHNRVPINVRVAIIQ